MPVLALAEPVGVVYDAVIKRVIDGDTVVIQAPYLPKPLKPEISVRIFGVDTPETKHPQKPVQYFGKGAYAFSERIIEENSWHIKAVW